MKLPQWTEDKIRKLDTESIKRLQDNASNLQNQDIVILCERELEVRGKRSLKNSSSKLGKTQGKYDDFLFTWKPDGWPYEKLKELIEEFEKNQEFQAEWRCFAHQKVYPGARAYFFKQGDKPNRGIFGIGVVVGEPKPAIDPVKGKTHYVVSVKFERLVDPMNLFLVKEKELSLIDDKETVWDSQASGMPIKFELARAIDNLIAKNTI